MTLEEKIQNAEKVEIHYKPPYKTAWAIVEYFGQWSRPLKVVSYYTYGEELITGKPLICYHWLPFTNFVIIEDSFTTEAEAKQIRNELRDLYQQHPDLFSDEDFKIIFDRRQTPNKSWVFTYNSKKALSEILIKIKETIESETSN